MKYINFIIKKEGAKYNLYDLLSNTTIEINRHALQIMKRLRNKTSPYKLNREELILYNNLYKYKFIQKEGTSNLPYNETALKNLDIQITSRCNLRCRHCLWSNLPSTDLDYNKIKNILFDFKKMGGVRVNITGGEPLLHKDISKILKLCRNLNLHIAVSSNGLLINNRIINDFKKYKVAENIVSLDGFRKSHEYIRGKNTFNKTLNNIKLLIKNNLPVYIRMMYYKKNARYYNKFKNFCKSLEIKSLITAPIINIDRTNKNKELFLSKRELKQYYKQRYDQNVPSLINSTENNFKLACGAGKRFIFISSSGNVCPCPLLSDFIMGNINKRRLITIYKSPDHSYDTIKYFNYKNIQCSKCSKFNVCRGGCRGIAYLNGDIYGVDPFACAKYL